MAFCNNCGQEVADNATVCANCGTAQVTAQTTTQTTAPKVADDGGFLWGLLGCCIPVVGLVLFIIWKDNKPKTAKAAGIGALVSVGCSIVFYAIYFVIMFVIAMAAY